MLPTYSRISRETSLKAKISLVQSQKWNTRTICEIYSKLTIKTPEVVFIVNFQQISRIVDFEQVNTS